MLIHDLFKKETIAQSVGIVLFFKIIERIIQVGRGIVFARFLGPSNYGVYTLAFFFIPLAAAVARLGIPSCFSRYVPQYEKKGELRNFFKKTFLLIAVVSATMTLICFFNARNISSMIYGSSVYYKIIIICSLSLLPYGIFEGLRASFSGLRVFKLTSIIIFSQFFIFTALGITLVIFYFKAEPVLLSYLISLIIVVLFFGLVFQKYLQKLNSQSLEIKENNFYGKIIKFSIFFVISPIIFTLFNYTDRWMLSLLTDLSGVGVYSVASNVSGIIFMFGAVVGSVLVPNLSNMWEQGEKDKVMYMLNFAIKINTLFLLSGAVLLFLFKKQVISILYGSEYMTSLPIIGILLIFWLCSSIFWTVRIYAQLIEKTYIPVICCSIGLISNILLNYVLIPRLGLIGAAVASTSSFAIILIIMFVLFRKEGLEVKTNTILVCILPLVFVLNSIHIFFFFLILFGIIFGTNLILSKDEKNTLYSQVKRAVSKFREKKNYLCP
jgi:O-antigen/teichoic acid export membrane protein